jgi:MarR family transcriptional regulator, lower aerobic nicotinate degradation pathway regulator
MRTIAPVTTNDVGFLLAKAGQRFNELLMERLAARGFTEVRPSYGSLLVPLFAHGDLRPGEIAEHGRLSKQSMTGLVKRCEQDGLVVRRHDPDDGRAFRISLTERGRELQAVAEEELAGLDELLVARLGPRKHDALIEALKGVMDL